MLKRRRLNHLGYLARWSMANHAHTLGSQAVGKLWLTASVRFLSTLVQTQDEMDHLAGNEGNQCEEDCVGAETSIRVCKCFRIGENNSRFILRLLEAMRNLEESDDCLVTSTVEEIACYRVTEK